MAVQVVDYAGANVAGVDSNHNQLVNLPTDSTKSGFSLLAVERDAGTVTGARQVAALDVSGKGADRLRVGTDSIWLNEVFPGSALNSAVWTSIISTMTSAVAAGYAVLNAGLSVASGAYAQIRTYRSFPGFVSFPVVFQARVQFSQLPQTNNVSEWGVGIAAAAAAPTDGAFFRLKADASFVCVTVNNSVETPSAALNFADLVSTNMTRHFTIEVLNGVTYFWIDQVMVASIVNPSASTTSSMMLPVMFRTYNSAATSAAQVMRIGVCAVTAQDLVANRPWPLVCTGMGGIGAQGQAGGTMGSTALYANSANPTAAVPTNTTAALGSGLGGNFWSLTTLAVNTDGIVSSYQVPHGTAALPGKTLVISGIRIASVVQTVLAGGPFVLQWGLAFGHTAVSLATLEAATTKAPRRKALGFQTFTAAAAVGVQGADIVVSFASPIPVQPGEFVQTIYKNIGTVGTGGTIAHAIEIDCFWE